VRDYMLANMFLGFLLGGISFKWILELLASVWCGFGLSVGWHEFSFSWCQIGVYLRYACYLVHVLLL